MASKKAYHLRACDKSYRNIGRRSYWAKWLSDKRAKVDPGSRCTRTAVAKELKEDGVRVAPNVFCSRGGCKLNFGIA